MSDLLNQASLVMVPSGYKEDTVFSVVPTDGSGDLSFTRASNGTRINSAGLVEVVPWNLLEQSETLLTPWSTSEVTYVTGQTDPNGTTTAIKIVASATTNFHYTQQPITKVNGEFYTMVVYAKSSGLNTCRIALSGGDYGDVNFSANTIAFANATGSIEDVGNGWKKITIVATADSTSESIYLLLGTGSFTGNGTDGVIFWHPQVNIGSTAKPYFPTTDRLNVPRLTYQNGGGGCPSLLLEKQSTNLFTYSEQLNNADWFTTGLTVTANQAISPDGTQNADLLDDGTASSTQHWIYQGTSFANSTTYTISFYAKYVSRKYMSVNIYNGSTSQYVDYDIENGLVYGSTGDVTASITSVGNGWYRVVYTRTMASSGSPNFRIAMADDTGSETYTGSNKQLYLWGMQCEASSYPTSYIPTTSSSATRVADECYKTGISSLIGQSDGTMFVQCNLQDSTGAGQAIATLYENSSNVIILYKQSDNVLKCFVVTGGTLVADLGSIAVSGNIKIAVGYKANDFALYINGVQRGTDTSGSVPTCSNLYLGADDGGAQKMSGTISQSMLFPTRLTNAELASLTTI